MSGCLSASCNTSYQPADSGLIRTNKSHSSADPFFARLVSRELFKMKPKGQRLIPCGMLCSPGHGNTTRTQPYPD